MDNFTAWVAWWIAVLPWEAIAGLTAVAALIVALFVAYRQTREGRQQIRRQAIADVHANSKQWLAEAQKIMYLYVEVIPTGDVREFERVRDSLASSTAAADSAFAFATMTCRDKKLLGYIQDCQRALYDFAGAALWKWIVDGPLEDNLATMGAAIQGGALHLSRFKMNSEAVSERGIQLYAMRQSVRKRLAATTISEDVRAAYESSLIEPIRRQAHASMTPESSRILLDPPRT